jgi:phosphatidate cytidylyltransferase
MLKTRVITALVLLAVFLPIVWLAPLIWLGALIALVITVAAWEWWRLLFPMNHKRAFSYAGICLLSLATMFMYASMDLVKILLFVTVLFWLIVVPYLMKQSLSLNIAKWRWPLAILGLLIFPTGWFALMHLRGGGLSVLISVLVLVWCADIGAYFAGKSFGKHKLAIHLSPGKSIEGAIGGWLVVMCIAFTYIKINQYLDLSSSNFFSILQDEFGWSGVFGVSTLCVLMSIQGDLFESQLKRVAGVKDSSNLLPGHGGILDRIDALLPVLPVAALITTFLV